MIITLRRSNVENNNFAEELTSMVISLVWGCAQFLALVIMLYSWDFAIEISSPKCTEEGGILEL